MPVLQSKLRSWREMRLSKTASRKDSKSKRADDYNSMRYKKGSDKALKNYSEKTINAFLTCNKISEIMKETGLGRTTIDRLRKDPVFQNILAERREAMLQGALDTMREQLQPAARRLIEIIEDPETPKQTAVNAIATLFTTVRNMTELCEYGKRIASLEEQAGKMDELWRKVGGAMRNG